MRRLNATAELISERLTSLAQEGAIGLSQKRPLPPDRVASKNTASSVYICRLSRMEVRVVTPRDPGQKFALSEGGGCGSLNVAL